MRNESMNTEEYEGDIGLNYNEEANSGGNGSNSRDNDTVERSNVKSVERSEDLNDLLNEGDVRKSTVSEINDDFINDADRNTDNDRGNKNENVKSGDCIGNDSEKNENINQSSYAKTLTKNMSNEGIQFVYCSYCPWLVNGKPLIVQKWDPEVVIVKESPCKIPIWIRLYNVPLEAWSIKGLSAISSRLGRPLMMDQMTSDMCKEGSGRLGYARVLVEIDASKSYLDKIEINYVDDEKKVKMLKWVRVEYSWKPDKCCYCNVFGHLSNYCKSKPVVNGDNGKKTKDNMNHLDSSKEGFVEVKNRKKNRFEANGSKYTGVNEYTQGNSKGWDQHQVKYIPKVPAPKPTPMEPKNNQSSPTKVQTPFKEKGWKVSKENIEELKKSANKFAVLSEDENVGEGEDPFINKRLIVDEFVRKKNDSSDEEDVYVNMNQAVNDLIADEVLVKDVGGIKVKSIKKTCNWVFGNWNWVSNVDHSPTCCRIVIGWNSLLMDVMIVHSCRQAILCLIESALMGDFNVILKPEEQSNGPSSLNNDMVEFRDVVKSLEIDDLCSSRFNFK
ncbi:RNA-directed DNA polymerase, eukaryota, reverse transcriptase zinc-binding domain protein [Tanacetum coccineum]